ncbi:pulmonary surfactant-associated protein A-like [Aythya fuligula]|uniref:Pulmonary surfactant-associated protein A-like n=1 Tax=Aythya fuligula TaxID=219594 RepID=A0A6J3DEA5_AYTFU|nr:pulmonary surfactant-associated protein A-like [Aythya fuligula]
MLSPQMFHRLLAVALFLLPCSARGNPTRKFLVPGFRISPEKGIAQGFISGFKSLPGNEMGDVILQIEDRISKLERVLHLEGMITASEGKIFATNGKTADFHTTVKTCEEAGGSIATPRNAGENDAILYFVKQFNRYAYLGIKESLIPGKFQFLDGAEPSYTNWHSNEPSGKGEEECVEMYTDGTWNNKKCNQNRLTVCQF